MFACGFVDLVTASSVIVSAPVWNLVTAVDRVVGVGVHLDADEVAEHVVTQPEEVTQKRCVVERVLEGCAADEDRPEWPVVVGAVLDAEVVAAGATRWMKLETKRGWHK